MELLLYIFIAVAIIGITLIITLFACNNQKTEKITFILATVFSMGLSFIGANSLPSNYTGQKIIFGLFGLLGILALSIYIRFPDKRNNAKYLLAGCLILEYLLLIFL
ncbi:MAG: hypothetical protein ACI3ZR_09660 [bacterium]